MSQNIHRSLTHVTLAKKKREEMAACILFGNQRTKIACGSKKSVFILKVLSKLVHALTILTPTKPAEIENE